MCKVDLTRWTHDLQMPDKMECQICDFEAQEWGQFQAHLRGHHKGPSSIDERLELRVMRNGERFHLHNPNKLADARMAMYPGRLLRACRCVQLAEFELSA